MTGTGRRCKSCEARLPGLARPDRFYCSPTCRQSAYERRRRQRQPALVTPAERSEIERILTQATLEERLVLQVAAAAAKGQWRASAWLLERRYPERWGRLARREELRPLPSVLSTDAAFMEEMDELARRRARLRS